MLYIQILKKKNTKSALLCSVFVRDTESTNWKDLIQLFRAIHYLNLKFLYYSKFNLQTINLNNN